MVRRITKEKIIGENPYERLGLAKNPFPNQPVAKYADRDRNVFSHEAHASIISQIEKKWIGLGNFNAKKRVGFFWAQSSGESDKGMGKSKILFYIIDKINNNYGEQYFKDKKICAVYVYAGTDWKEPRLICVEAMRRLGEEGAINEAINNIALDILEENGVDTTEAQNNIEKIFSEDWLKEVNWSIPKLGEFIAATLVEFGVREDLAEAVANRKFIDYLENRRSDHSLRLPPAASDWRLTKEAAYLFFDQSMRILAAGGFDHCYLFVDDIENIIRHKKMTKGYLHDMARFLGGNIFREDRPSASAFVVNDIEYGPMLSLFLTTHLKAADDLSPGWHDAGYDTFAPLNSAAPNSICVTPLTDDSVLSLAKAYLAKYRLDSSKLQNNYYPFEEGAIIKVAEQSHYHPRKLLSNLHIILEEAKEDDSITVIDKDTAMELLTGASSGTIEVEGEKPLEDFGHTGYDFVE